MSRHVGSAVAGTGLRFLHTADWQLGMTRHFLDADAQPRYSGARLEAITALAELAEREDCEFVLVCGDVFESNAVSERVVQRAAERLAAFTVPVYLLPGNHDPLDAVSIYRRPTFLSAMPAQVRVLTQPGRHPVRPGVEIVAAPWTSKHPNADLLAQALEGIPSDGTVRVVAGHGRVDSLSPDRTDRAMIGVADLEAALASGAVHFVALGDRHSVTSVGETGRIWYSGTSVVTDYDELEPGRALVVDTNAEQVCVTAHRVGTWRFVNLVRTVDGPSGVDDLLGELDGIGDKDTTVLRLSITGTLSLTDKARWEDGLDRLRVVFASIEVWDKRSDLAIVVDDDEFADIGVRGYAAAAVADLARAANGAGIDSSTDTARDALALLHRLVAGRV